MAEFLINLALQPLKSSSLPNAKILSDLYGWFVRNPQVAQVFSVTLMPGLIGGSFKILVKIATVITIAFLGYYGYEQSRDLQNKIKEFYLSFNEQTLMTWVKSVMQKLKMLTKKIIEKYPEEPVVKNLKRNFTLFYLKVKKLINSNFTTINTNDNI